MNALKLWCKAHSVYSEANKAESLFEGLTGRMKANGWTLIYYGDGGPGDQKLGVLGLSEYTKELRAFSCSSPVKVIGLRNTLSQADKLDALAHEIGHIECGHDLGSLTDRDEAEAERFARVLCARRPRHVVRWSAVIIAAFCLSFGAGVLFANRSVDNPSDLPSAAPEVENVPVSNTIGKETEIEDNAQDIQVVVTTSGDKYHLPNCQYVKDKKDDSLRTLTIQEARDEGKEPCKVCRPDELLTPEK